MYCGQCGKRVLDDMLFCPFCGSPIVIPDQDEPAPQAKRPQRAIQGESTPAQEPEAEAAFPTEAVPEAALPEEVEPEAEEAAPEAENSMPEASNSEAKPSPAQSFSKEPEPEHEPEPEPKPEPKREEPRRFVSLFEDADSDDADDADFSDDSNNSDKSDGASSGNPFDAEEEDGESFDPLRFDRADEPDHADIPDWTDEPDQADASDWANEPNNSDKPNRPAAPGGRAFESGASFGGVRREPPRKGAPRRAPEPAGRRSSQTYIPVRDVNPDDMFMDSSHPSKREEYDPYDDDGGAEADFDEDFSFDDGEPEGFLRRHVRGAVGLALLLALLLIFLIWLATPGGQRLLAPANLAWNAQVYNDLGYEAYEAGQHRRAASYFERAVARDGNNYDYAHSAMVAYYEAGETDRALSMLKRCIDMNPDSPEPYAELMILYPDAASRPWEVQQLLRQGYERTGEESLNVSGE